MLYPDRATVCVSSQAGCAMGCGFCATGQAGFTRHLTTGEIVEQVVRAARRARDGGRRVSNVVFMGMGEPLANEAAVWGAVERLHGDLGLSARHLTISTVGIVPGIRRLAERRLPVTLAVSLHAANDELRDELVPINRRYDLDDAARRVRRVPGRQRPAAELRVGADRRRQRPPVRRRRAGRAVPAAAPGRPRQPDPAEPDARLADDGLAAGAGRASSATGCAALGVNATVRRNRGTDIDAACGQLARGDARSARQQPASRTYGYGLTAAPPPGCTSKWRCGVPRALPVSPT